MRTSGLSRSTQTPGKKQKENTNSCYPDPCLPPGQKKQRERNWACSSRRGSHMIAPETLLNKVGFAAGWEGDYHTAAIKKARILRCGPFPNSGELPDTA